MSPARARTCRRWLLASRPASRRPGLRLGLPSTPRPAPLVSLLVSLLFVSLLSASASPLCAQELPAGTLLNVRLRHPLYSYSARRGQPVRVVLIAPVVLDGVVRLPAGSELSGTITDVRAVGLGLRRERARLGFRFDRVTLPSGETLTLDARLHTLSNAREKLDDQQRITGIRATSAIGYQVSGWIVGAATGDVLLMTFALAGGTAIIRFPESEIILPAGTEMLLHTAAPLTVTRAFPAPVDPVARTEEERARLQALVASLPFRTSTPGGTPSDLTNVLLVGDEPAIARAFHAAGWSTAAELSASTAYRTFRSMAEKKGYDEAPMSLLQLDGRSPVETWQKGLNTFSARHHLRVFPVTARLDERPVWPISGTQDIGIGFSRQARTLIHLIDPTIDNERNKIVNDLTFTGCVDAVELVPRPFIPKDARNATHDPLLTDGQMAIVRLNDCLRPRPFVEPALDVPVGRALGNPVQRGFRRFFLSMKHQLWRGNIVYSSASKAATGMKMVFGKKEKEPAPERTLIIEGVAYSVASDPAAPLPEAEQAEDVIAGAVAEAHAAGAEANVAEKSPVEKPRPVRDEPSVELYLGPAVSRAEELGTFVIGFGGEGQTTAVEDDLLLLVSVPLRVSRAKGVAASVTLPHGRWIAHEISYDYSRADLRFGFDKATVAVFDARGDELLASTVATDVFSGPIVVRSLGYAFTAHARPREARIRPYALIGPEIAAYRLSGRQHNSRLFGRIGLGNVGSVIGALKSARKAPLDGGTIFRWGLTYGVGVRARLTSTWGLRADFRETFLATPDFASIDPEDVRNSKETMIFAQESDRIRRRSFTIGATFSF